MFTKNICVRLQIFNYCIQSIMTKRISVFSLVNFIFEYVCWIDEELGVER